MKRELNTHAKLWIGIFWVMLQPGTIGWYPLSKVDSLSVSDDVSYIFTISFHTRYFIQEKLWISKMIMPNCQRQSLVYTSAKNATF